MLTHPESITSPAPQRTLTEMLAQANAHWRAREIGPAELQCRTILTRRPGQGDALHLLGLMAHARGELDAAITYLQAACRATRAPAIHFSNLAEMYRRKAMYREGEVAGRRAVALAPNLASAWNNLGIILQEAGQYEESGTCLETALRLQPQNAETCNNLGNTCKRLGRLADAERHWRRAMALNPNYAQPHSNLANLLGEQGAYEEAIASGRRALELDPRLTDAYVNLAGIESGRQRYLESLAWTDALLAFAPSHAIALASRALALIKLEHHTEALAAARRAVASAPGNAEARNALGTVLQANGRFEEALAAFEAAQTMPGTAAEQATMNRAVLFMEKGEQEQAKAAFDQAAQLFPRSVSLFYNRADITKFEPGDPAIDHMLALLNDKRNTSRNDAMLLHFSLAKAYFDTNEPQSAFLHLDQANAMKRAVISYDADKTTRMMADVARVFSPETFANFGNAGPSLRRPIFIVGMPRSGTTLTKQILASHPQIHGAGELGYIQRLAPTIAFPNGLPDTTTEKLRTLGEAYLQRIEALGGDKPHIVDKMPANFIHAGLIRLILPEARIIHCRRNAPDTTLSCYTKLFSGDQSFSYNQTELGRFYRDYEKLTSHWRDVLPATHFLEVEYEAMVDDLEPEAKRMLDFLGLDWDPACLSFQDTKRAVRTASLNQVRQPIYKTSKGRWRKYAPYLGPLLAELGMEG